MKLLISGQETKAPLDIMEQAAEICARLESVAPEQLEISLSFVSPEEIHSLNREYRGVDRVTDVLSFPMVEDLNELPAADAAEAPEEEQEEAAPIPLGDVVICAEKAREQAEEYGHSEERELVYLFVHSVLHLLGYDHMEPEEKAEMRAREEEIMQRLGLSREE